MAGKTSKTSTKVAKKAAAKRARPISAFRGKVATGFPKRTCATQTRRRADGARSAISAAFVRAANRRISAFGLHPPYTLGEANQPLARRTHVSGKCEWPYSSFHVYVECGYVRRGLKPAEWAGDAEEPMTDFGERSG